MAAKTTKAGRAVLRAIEPIVASSGGRCWMENAAGGHGHQRIIISIGKHTRFTPLSNSQRLIDQAIKHKVADVRKLLAEIRALSA